MYGLCKHHDHDIIAEDKPLKIDLDKFVERAIKNIYAGKTNPGQPDAELVRATADELWKAVKKGWNVSLQGQGVKYGSQEQRLLIQMRHNTFVTSVFKYHHFALDVARELFDDKGNVRNFSDFRKAVKDKVDPNYNKNWLRTEYNTAYAAGQMARKWQTYVKKGGFIVYVAVRDDRTRPDHADMHGARYPVDHPFWLVHFPPNGFNCRCTTRWDGTEGDLIAPATIEDVPPFFQNNVGMTGLVFKDSPYFTTLGEFKEQAEKLFGFKPPVDLQKYEANLQLYNSLIADKDFKIAFVDNLTGGFVFRHVKKTNDLQENLQASKLLAMKGDSVVIRPVINRHGIKNPDVLWNGIETEIKTNSEPTSSAIDNALRKAKGQSSIIVLNVLSKISIPELEKAIYNRVRRTSTIKEIMIIYQEQVYTLTAEEIRNETFYGKIK